MSVRASEAGKRDTCGNCISVSWGQTHGKSEEIVHFVTIGMRRETELCQETKNVQSVHTQGLSISGLCRGHWEGRHLLPCGLVGDRESPLKNGQVSLGLVEICGGGQDESPDQLVTAWWNGHFHPQATFCDMSLHVSLNSISTETSCIKKLILGYHTWAHLWTRGRATDLL